jgi:hypothetical protein
MTEIEQPLYKQFALNLRTFRFCVTSATTDDAKLASVEEN